MALKSTLQNFTNAALNATGLASAVAYSGGGYALSANSAGDSLAHLITFKNKSANDHSGKTVTITGTDANGRAQTQAITGPAGNATVTTTAYFLTVTSVTISATTNADTFDIGWTATSVGPTINMDPRTQIPNVGIFCRVPSTTPTYAVQYSGDLASSAAPDDTSWLDTTITGKSATFGANVTAPINALRLKFTAAGIVAMTVLEALPG